ncbi:MAG: hypothetical protein DSY91_01135 [Deltaproteobacteria bacterium]|nr:MAG: hypothetical protein DSY91_01135 [Deltaproteobacteria bacterium]
MDELSKAVPNSGKMSFSSLSDFFRSPRGLFIFFIGIILSLFHLYTSEFGLYPAMVQRNVHLSLGMAIVFLIRPSGKGGRWSAILDFLLIAGAMAACWHLIFTFRDVVMRGGNPTNYDLLLGGILILLVLEGTRRILGWPLPIIAIVSILYALLGGYIPGTWGHRGVYWDELIGYNYLTTEGIFTIPLGVSASFIYIFILFGAFLVESGTGAFFIRLANAVAGKYRGGPAKVAIFSSSLFGTISGSAVANVVSTGSFTIPLMRKIGYNPTFAGAVEAVASTGGQFMPPVMGAGAFIMAEMLGIPYVRVCAAAALPAVLYFFSLFYMTHMEALRLGLRGMEKSEIPSLPATLKAGGHLLFPAGILLYLLIQGYSPMKAGFWSIMAILACSALRRETRMSVLKIVYTLAKGATGALEVIMACACAGIVIGAVTQTGLGLKFSGLVVEASGGSLILSLIFIMVATLILGMGLTTSAAYILTVILGGPVLLKLGVQPIAAHMFVFYYACLSAITPPVALAAFAGAGISGARPFQTGFTAMKLAIIAYLIPFTFVYHPALLWEGSLFTIGLAFLFDLAGTIAIGSALMGYFLNPLSYLSRFLLFFSSLGMFWHDYRIRIAGSLIFVVVISFEVMAFIVKRRGVSTART